ncbi:MAG: hypothetical protein DI629_09555 [Mesorhizobium amorphae]|nr:MAG: hypothetical protein DI629_09555 [Mesorhizobium amorphae]
MKRLVIVGNGPLGRDWSAHVDAADFVLRFNEPKAGIGLSGTRTDRLMMANSGKPMQRRLRDPALIGSPIFRAAREVVLAYHPDIIQRFFPRPNVLSRIKGRRADWTWATILAFGRAGKTVSVLPRQFYLDGCAALGLSDATMREVFPSTGYFGVWDALERFPAAEWRIELVGFSWAGWRRHAWGDERSFVERAAAEGRLHVLDGG